MACRKYVGFNTIPPTLLLTINGYRQTFFFLTVRNVFEFTVIFLNSVNTVFEPQPILAYRTQALMDILCVTDPYF